MPTGIREIKARILYNSRGEESIEVDVSVEGAVGRASSPSGASVGRHEAVNFAGGTAKSTIERLESYKTRLIGLDASDPHAVASGLKEVDGSANWSGIGGSAAYAITIASVEAAARAIGVPLYQLLLEGREARMPLPLGNVLGGGSHAGEGSPDIQEFLSFPKGARSIGDAIRANIEVHREVRRILAGGDLKFTGGKGDEGAWAPNLSNEQALEAVHRAISSVSDRMGFEIRMGVDMASSSLYDEDEGKYIYSREGVSRDAEDQIQYVLELIDKFRIYYLEDPLHEEAFDDFASLSSKTSESLIVGDDLFVTKRTRLERGISLRAANSVILKVNQTGALADALDFAETARKNNYLVVASHRSGDTADSHLAHIAIGTSSAMIKSGVVGGERVAKLNELLRIDEQFRFIRGGSTMPPASAV